MRECRWCLEPLAECVCDEPDETTVTEDRSDEEARAGESLCNLIALPCC